MDIQNILNKAIKELKEAQAPDMQNFVNTFSPESTNPLQETTWDDVQKFGSGLVDKFQSGAQGFKDFIRGADSTVRDFGEKTLQPAVDNLGTKLQPAVDNLGTNIQQIYNQGIAPTIEKGAGYLKQFVTDPGQYFKDLGSNLKAFGQQPLDKAQDFGGDLKAFGQQQLDKAQGFFDKLFPNGFPVKIGVGGKDITPIVGSPMTKFFDQTKQDWNNADGILDFIKNRPDLAAGAGIPAALLAGAGALALRRRQRAAQGK